MRISELTIERALTINLGNYESARFSASMTAQLDPDDDPDDVYEIVCDMIMEKLQADIDSFSIAG